MELTKSTYSECKDTLGSLLLVPPRLRLMSLSTFTNFEEFDEYPITMSHEE